MTNKFYSIVDFGSSKIRFSVFNSKLDEEYSQSVLLTDNYNENFENIKKFIKNGERKISNHIEEIILLLDSSNIFSIDITLKKKSDPKINLKKIYDLILMELDQLINLNYINFKIIHRIISKCKIDGIEYNEIPSNIKNVNNVIIDFKLICLPKKLIDNLIKEFNKNNLKIINIFCTSYVKAVNYMRKVVEDKISFLEIGYSRSTLIVYEKNTIKLIQSIPIGGNHVTNDISKVFKISFDEAEKIKKLFNKSETEFSYKDNNNYSTSIRDVLKKNISIDTLKKVILYRIQEILDLIFKKSNISKYNIRLNETELFLIGGGSTLFDNNSFYLNDKFEFKSLNFYSETDKDICYSGLIFHINNYKLSKSINKKLGLFEKFFNFFSE